MRASRAESRVASLCMLIILLMCNFTLCHPRFQLLLLLFSLYCVFCSSADTINTIFTLRSVQQQRFSGQTKWTIEIIGNFMFFHNKKICNYKIFQQVVFVINWIRIIILLMVFCTAFCTFAASKPAIERCLSHINSIQPSCYFWLCFWAPDTWQWNNEAVRARVGALVNNC